MKNTKRAVTEFKRRLSAEVRMQEKLYIVEKRYFKKGELLEKYTAKILYKWNNEKFEKKYLKKLERNWQKWKSVFLEKKP